MQANKNPSIPLPRRSHATLLSAFLASALLAACGGGVDSDEAPDKHENTTIDTAGRLALTENNAKTLRLFDLDSGTTEASHVLDNVPSAIYASPNGRYAVAMQRLQDQVQFVDAGIWQEDHGDHLHDYKQASKPVAWKLSGSRPTHYDLQAGKQAAFFMDGDSTATPAKNAGVRLISDASIASGGTLAALDLSAPIHGLGEPVDNKLLVVSRAADAPDALPTHLNLYQREGATYRLDRQVPTRCNGMHGSFSAGAYTVAGCLDGMLLVKHLSATAVSDGQKLLTPLRVGTIAGHARLGGHFIGVATEGAAPGVVTTRFYAVDGDAGTVSSFTPQGWMDGRVRRAHGFDRSGKRFALLDDQGTLILSQHQNKAWSPLARVAGVIPSMPTAAPWPAIVANGAKDELYITDPQARQLVVVDSSTGAVKSRRNLDFVPSGLAWLGITR